MTGAPPGPVGAVREPPPAEARGLSDTDPRSDAAAQPGAGRLRGPRLPARLRAFVRAREAGLVLIGVAVGAASGGLVALVSWLVQGLHVILFGLPVEARLSASDGLSAARILLVPVCGGLVLAGLGHLARRMGGRLADAIEANALYGGRLSLTGSLLVTLQTVASCGFGASVGLEAGYAQICSAVASRLGLAIAARRSDLRLLVACGAGGAIAAAFAAPLAGAFYGFEVVLGTYTVAAMAPMAASCLTANLLARLFWQPEYLLRPNALPAIAPHDVGPILLIAVGCALAGIALMHAVSASDFVFRRSGLPVWLRPAAGGAVVGVLGLVSPQVLGAGHGAMERDLVTAMAPAAVMTVIALKGTAAAVSLGSGFRGGLFYASLLIGALLGRLYADGSPMLPFGLRVDPDLAALTGMAAFGTGVIGAPLTMTALALETTGNFAITLGALLAAAVSSVLVRELFGYSFATWRFHLRGETIRGPHDVGWVQDLAVRKLMRADIRTMPAATRIGDARALFPLGTQKHIVALDARGRYAGVVALDDLYTSPESGAQPVGTLTRFADAVLLPGMSVRQALACFQAEEADVLAVVDDPATRVVLGLLTEAHALRRYGEELERQNPDVVTAGPGGAARV